jgi:ABC-type Fe3+-hydroxamate transport system substrate-binding protein
MNSPQRVVSLVPSMTESMFEFGVGERLVGVTDYCISPAERVKAISKVGGTKNVNRSLVISLAPDLIIANQEENTRDDVEFFQASGIEVWLSFPKTMRQAIDEMWELIRRFNVPLQGQRIVTLEKTYEWTSMAADSKESLPRVFCPIWREADWWMTVNGDTYTSDVIKVCGGANVFAARQRRYPLAADLDPTQQPQDEPERDTRYPRVTLEEILESQPDVILLPTEPFEFSDVDVEYWMQFGDLPAAQNNRVHVVDGSLLTWHGVRLAMALREVPSLLNF